MIAILCSISKPLIGSFKSENIYLAIEIVSIVVPDFEIITMKALLKSISFILFIRYRGSRFSKKWIFIMFLLRLNLSSVSIALVPRDDPPIPITTKSFIRLCSKYSFVAIKSYISSIISC